MPTYYFHLHDRWGSTPDETGREFADPGAVRKHALKAARAMIAEDVSKGCLDLRGRIEVTDNVGNLLLMLPFADAVERLDGN
ncbi:MAG TPA: hypothetical protein VGB57_05685 [Allosphingosinicella sp.]|jgi:hypothetical protein